MASNTKLGWILSGPAELSHRSRIDGSKRSCRELESLGINKREDPIQEQFDEKIPVKDGRYQVALPWLRFHEPLPTNYELSLEVYYKN